MQFHSILLSVALVATTCPCPAAEQTTVYRRVLFSGNSMGGHGACRIGFRHTDVLGAVASIFGGMDLRPFPNNWDIAKRLGPLVGKEEFWRTGHGRL